MTDQIETTNSPTATKPAAPSARRFGAKESTTRAALVQAGTEVLQTQGAGGFTAKRVAEQAGLKPQLVHYYFRTMEDLLLAIVDHAGELGLQRAARAAASNEPLRELWNVALSERSTTLTAEVRGLAQNSPALRDATIRQQEAYRTLMAEALQRNIEEHGGKLQYPPMTVIMIVDAVARLLVSEEALGFTLGHDQLRSAIDQWLDGHYAP